ncbi:MAG TPA: hypothetical protein DEP84_08565 [Chloroflexi bacterium]|nr:hypothetical protein [Chloroflexota bacterium]
MSHITADLRSVIEAAPDQTFRAIVRTVDAPSAYVDQAEQAGLTVHRTYKLLQCMAVSGQGEALLRLAEAPWVQSIEPDKTVTTM